MPDPGLKNARKNAENQVWDKPEKCQKFGCELAFFQKCQIRVSKMLEKMPKIQFGKKPEKCQKFGCVCFQWLFLRKCIICGSWCHMMDLMSAKALRIGYGKPKLWRKYAVLHRAVCLWICGFYRVSALPARLPPPKLPLYLSVIKILALVRLAPRFLRKSFLNQI